MVAADQFVLAAFPSIFFFIVTPTSPIYTLSLHDALPIYEFTVPDALVMRQVAHRIEHARESVRRQGDRKSTRLNSSHLGISYAVFCLKKKTTKNKNSPRETVGTVYVIMSLSRSTADAQY